MACDSPVVLKGWMADPLEKLPLILLWPERPEWVVPISARHAGEPTPEVKALREWLESLLGWVEAVAGDLPFAQPLATVSRRSGDTAAYRVDRG